VSDIITPLVRDLVAWVAPAPRPYGEVIEAWRTNCPRLTVWEDAVEGGFVVLTPAPAGELLVVATDRGRALLTQPG
jgi:hypothetical protein